MLRRQRQKAEAVEFRHRLDGDAPVGAALRDRGGHRVVRLRLVGIAGRPRAPSSWSISTRVPAPALRLTISADASARSRLERLLRAASLEALVAGAEQDALHALPARHQREAGRHQMHIILSARRIDQMHRRDVAFAAAGRRHAAETADRQRARREAASASAPTTTSSATSWLPMMTRSGARAALPINVTCDVAAGIERRGQRVDLEKAVGLRETGHRAGAFAGRKRHRCPRRFRSATPARIPCGPVPRRCAPARALDGLGAASGGRPARARITGATKA